MCRHCREPFPIARTARAAGHPPAHRMYAKLVLRRDGTKEYLRITKEDLSAYRACLRPVAALNPCRCRAALQDGHNTHQILNYGYRHWHELFNERQLLALSMLGQAIRNLPAVAATGRLGDAFLRRAGVQQYVRIVQGRGHGRGAAHVRAPHPETGANAHRGQCLGHPEKLRRVLDAISFPASQGAGLSGIAV